MNAIFLQMSSTRKSHNPKMTKTLETNITSDKGEEKSQNITYLLLSNKYIKLNNIIYIISKNEIWKKLKTNQKLKANQKIPMR